MIRSILSILVLLAMPVASARSTEVILMAKLPPAVSGLSATAVSASRIDLAWVDGTRREADFKIERSPVGVDDWQQIGAVGAGVTVYSDNGRQADTTYRYRVWAHNSSGDGEYSPEASARTAWTPTKLGVPRDHLAMAMARGSGGRAIVGEFFAYDYDGIGNRLSECVGGAGRRGYCGSRIADCGLNDEVALPNPKSEILNRPGSPARPPPARSRPSPPAGPSRLSSPAESRP